MAEGEVAAAGASVPVPLRRRLAPVVELLAAEASPPTSARAAGDAWRVHVADSLTGLEVAALRGARRIGDVGSGAGFPGLVLAAALPEAEVEMIESVARKCGFIDRALAAAGLTNGRVVCERAETWAAAPPPRGGRDAYDVVAARAVGRLATLAELASPLLRDGGVLVAWKGRRDTDEEAELGRAQEALAMRAEEILWVGPYAGSRHRHLHVLRKLGSTPERLPRRPGMAKKRPFGGAA